MAMKEKLKNINENSYNNFMLKIGKYFCHLHQQADISIQFIITDKIRMMACSFEYKSVANNSFDK